MQQIWIMMFKLLWNIEQFMKSMDGLEELGMQGYSDNYGEDGCEVHVTSLIMFHGKSKRKEKVLYGSLYQCSWYLHPVALL